MNNFLKILIIFLFTTNCSYNKGLNFWSKKANIEKKEVNKKEIFKKDEALSLEFNPNLKISLDTLALNKSSKNTLDNNNGRIDYSGNIKNTSKFKFSQIKNFHQYDPKISFYKDEVIFFDKEGSIFKFNNNSKLIWKKNNYTKSEKKLNKVLFFANDKENLIVADSIGKYYALNIISGKLLWIKDGPAPFNSQVKIYNDKFFVTDFENTLRAYSVKDGSEIWNIKTQNSLIRSQKKLSLVIVEDKIYFNNSIGDISAVNIFSGELLWQSPTRSSLIYNEDFFLKTSDIVADKNSLYFSNNKNQFFSLDIKTGTLNWKQKINSNLRSTLINDYIFTVTLEGYLVIIEKNTGNIIKISDIFKNFKQKERVKIKPTGFVIGNDSIYLTTDHGRLVVIDLATGITKAIIKIDNNKISRPAIIKQNLFIVSDKSIIKLN